jgi:hypothetical protein
VNTTPLALSVRSRAPGKAPRFRFAGRGLCWRDSQVGWRKQRIGARHGVAGLPAGRIVRVAIHVVPLPLLTDPIPLSARTNGRGPLAEVDRIAFPGFSLTA